eukprot:Rhum_TRINITY_DN14643_c23_g1::Rhum_TRINITY_DN14643_c23_g1_i1::g.107497::m.107497
MKKSNKKRRFIILGQLRCFFPPFFGKRTMQGIGRRVKKGKLGRAKKKGVLGRGGGGADGLERLQPRSSLGHDGQQRDVQLRARVREVRAQQLVHAQHPVCAHARVAVRPQRLDRPHGGLRAVPERQQHAVREHARAVDAGRAVDHDAVALPDPLRHLLHPRVELVAHLPVVQVPEVHLHPLDAGLAAHLAHLLGTLLILLQRHDQVAAALLQPLHRLLRRERRQRQRPRHVRALCARRVHLEEGRRRPGGRLVLRRDRDRLRDQVCGGVARAAVAAAVCGGRTVGADVAAGGVGGANAGVRRGRAVDGGLRGAGALGGEGGGLGRGGGAVGGGGAVVGGVRAQGRGGAPGGRLGSFAAHCVVLLLLLLVLLLQ